MFHFDHLVSQNTWTSWDLQHLECIQIQCGTECIGTNGVSQFLWSNLLLLGLAKCVMGNSSQLQLDFIVSELVMHEGTIVSAGCLS